MTVQLDNGGSATYVIDPTFGGDIYTVDEWKKIQPNFSQFDLTDIGEAPTINVNGMGNYQLPGTGYMPGGDPSEGADVNAERWTIYGFCMSRPDMKSKQESIANTECWQEAYKAVP